MLNTPCSSVMDKEKDIELRSEAKWQSLIEYLQGKGKSLSGVIPRFLALPGLVFKCSFWSFPSHHSFPHPIPRHFFPSILGIIIVPYPNHFFKHVFHCITMVYFSTYLPQRARFITCQAGPEGLL